MIAYRHFKLMAMWQAMETSDDGERFRTSVRWYRTRKAAEHAIARGSCLWTVWLNLATRWPNGED